MRFFFRSERKEVPIQVGKIPILLVGEAPGKEEVKEGRPFVGRAGKFLREKLKEFGINPDLLWITNAIHYQIPDRESSFKHLTTENLNKLYKDVKLAKPKLIVALGRTAEEALARLGYNYFYLPHPMAAIRNLKEREVFISGLKELVEDYSELLGRKVVEVLSR
jgi:uracil-DNA glycosylase